MGQAQSIPVRASLQATVDALKAASASVDSAISDVRGKAVAARDDLARIYSVSGTDDNPGAASEQSALLTSIDSAELEKISALERELVSLDALLVEADALAEQLKQSSRSDSVPKDQIPLFQAFHDKASAVLSLKPPVTDLMLLVVPRSQAGSATGGFGAMLLTQTPPIIVDLHPGQVVPIPAATRRGGLRGIIVAVHADADTVDLIIEPEDAAERASHPLVDVNLSATPLIVHSSSWSGCGGNPVGIAKCSGSGCCSKGACRACGASTHWRCCGDPVEDSKFCVIGTTTLMATKNERALYEKSSQSMRCDTVDGAAFAPAAYGTLYKGHPAEPIRDAMRAEMSQQEQVARQQAWIQMLSASSSSGASGCS